MESLDSDHLNQRRDLVISLIVFGLDLIIVALTTYSISYEILNLLFALESTINVSFISYLLLVIPTVLLDASISLVMKHRIVEFEKRGLVIISFFVFSLFSSLFFLSFNIITE